MTSIAKSGLKNCRRGISTGRTNSCHANESTKTKGRLNTNIPEMVWLTNAAELSQMKYSKSGTTAPSNKAVHDRGQRVIHFRGSKAAACAGVKGILQNDELGSPVLCASTFAVVTGYRTCITVAFVRKSTRRDTL